MSNYSILAAVTPNNQTAGIRAVISGVEKVGKTTLACTSPRPLLVPLEQGYSGIKGVMCTPLIETFPAVLMLLDEIIALRMANQPFDYKTLVFDSATALERLIHDFVLTSDPRYAKGNKKALTMEEALGGYGKAYQFANEQFSNFLNKCDWLSTYCGINIILTCHVFAARVMDPQHGEFDTWDLLLHSPKNQKSYGKREMITQWADLIGFLHEPLFVMESDDSKMKKGISSNKGRVLAVTRTPGYVAGNRYNVIEDISIPREKGWNNLAHSIYNSSGNDFFNRD